MFKYFLSHYFRSPFFMSFIQVFKEKSKFLNMTYRLYDENLDHAFNLITDHPYQLALQYAGTCTRTQP